MRLNYPRTFLLGFGFFAISVTTSLYNAYVPLFYKAFLSSTFLIGAAMVIDNVAAITLQPLFGAMSDRTWNRFGRRIPYILIGFPLAGAFFFLMPLQTSLWTLVAVTLVVNLGLSIARAPTIALMPDITPSPLRSKANGVINFMGGVGAALAFGAGAPLYRAAPWGPFAVAAGILALVALLLWRFIPEPKEIERAKSFSLWEATDDVFRARDRSGLFLLLSITAWFIGYAGVEALFTLYATTVLGMRADQAAFNLLFLAALFVLFAIPSGFIATRYGRRSTIRAGLIGMVASMLGLLFFRDTGLLRLVLAFGGISWALVNINSYPMVVELGKEGETGAYTGLYYIASALGAITGPPLFGALMDWVGYPSLFIWGLVFFALAFLLMGFVRRGEAVPAQGAVGAPVGAAD